MHARAGPPHLIAALLFELLAQVHNLGARLIYNLQDLIALRRRQLQLMLHPLDERFMRKPQPSVTISQAARGEPDRQARDRDHNQQPASILIRQDLIRQDRYSRRASRVSAGPKNPSPAVPPLRKSNPNWPERRRRTGTARSPRSRRAARPRPPPTIPPRPRATDATGGAPEADRPKRAAGFQPHDERRHGARH